MPFASGFLLNHSVHSILKTLNEIVHVKTKLEMCSHKHLSCYFIPQGLPLTDWLTVWLANWQTGKLANWRCGFRGERKELPQVTYVANLLK